MDDKTMLEGILWDLKAIADLSLHGTIESATPNVYETFMSALKEILSTQHDLYTLMSELGMYNVCNVENSKITKAKSKYNETLEG